MTAEDGARARLRKAREFVWSPHPEDYRVTARPWREPGHPYHFGRVASNPDGHGGYARAHSFDAAGVPCTPGPAGHIYHPLVVARYAMKMLEIAAGTGDPEAGRRARAMLPVLRESGRPTGAWGTGPDPDRMSAERSSCIVQGVVLSALIRLCDGAPDPDLASLIDRAVARLVMPLDRGGTLSSLHGGSFLEENPGTPVSHVLNGCLYGLFGLYDAADALGHPEAGRTARDVEATLPRAVASFTAPLGWSYYALEAHGCRYIARSYYHATHVVQASVVAARTEDAAIEAAARVWARALGSLSTRLLYGAAKSAQVIWMRDIRRVPLESASW